VFATDQLGRQAGEANGRRWYVVSARVAAEVYPTWLPQRPTSTDTGSEERIMTTHETELSRQNKELVALGASIGAGCHPCLAHHLKAAKQADLTEDRVRAAITNAQHGAAEAAEDLARSVQRHLDPDNATPTAPATLDPQDTELSALGAAIGANDRTNIEHHLTAAAALGVTPAQLRQAIEVAHTVQINAADIHLRAAQHWLDKMTPAQTPSTPDPAEQQEGCGCHQ